MVLFTPKLVKNALIIGSGIGITLSTYVGYVSWRDASIAPEWLANARWLMLTIFWMMLSIGWTLYYRMVDIKKWQRVWVSVAIFLAVAVALMPSVAPS